MAARAAPRAHLVPPRVPPRPGSRPTRVAALRSSWERGGPSLSPRRVPPPPEVLPASRCPRVFPLSGCPYTLPRGSQTSHPPRPILLLTPPGSAGHGVVWLLRCSLAAKQTNILNKG